MSTKKVVAAIFAFAMFVLLSFLTILSLHTVFGMEVETIKSYARLIILLCIVFASLLSLGIYRLIVGSDFSKVNRNFVSKVIWGHMWGTGNGFGSKRKSEYDNEDESEREEKNQNDDEAEGDNDDGEDEESGKGKNKKNSKSSIIGDILDAASYLP